MTTTTLTNRLTLTTGATIAAQATDIVASGNTLFLQGTIDNQGTIDDGNGGELSIGGNTVILTGGGTLQVSGTVYGAQSTAYYGIIPAPGTLVNADDTILGSGTIGLSYEDMHGNYTGAMLALVNGPAGTIDANGAQPLILEGDLPAYNAGVLEATGTGGLDFQLSFYEVSSPVDATVFNAGGTLLANGAGAFINLNGDTVSGGVLATRNAGTITGAGTLDNVTIAAGSSIDANGTTLLGTVDNNGILSVAAGATLSLSGSLTGNGAITLAPGGTIALDHAVTSLTFNNGTLAATDNGARVASLKLTGNYTDDSFQLVGIGGNSAIILDNAINSTGLTLPPGSTAAATDDFTGNGVSDILLENGSSGQLTGWLQQNGNVYDSDDAIGTLTAGSTVVGSGDFTGNGISDLLVQTLSTGQLVDWQIDSSGAVAAKIALGGPPAGYSVAGSGDFTGNGTSDILLQNTGTGKLQDWVMRNGAITTVQGLPSLPAGWSVAGTGDFSGNGTASLLLVNAATGQLADRQASSSTITAITTPQPGWRLAGTGDFNGDGTTDILFRNAGNGQLADWIMGNGKSAGWHILGNPGTGTTIAGIGDYAGNNTSDILLQNTACGALTLLQMSAGTIASIHTIGSLGTGSTALAV